MNSFSGFGDNLCCDCETLIRTSYELPGCEKSLLAGVFSNNTDINAGINK